MLILILEHMQEMHKTALLCLLCAIVSVTIVQAHNFSFPASAPWYQDVSAAALAPNSAAILDLLDSKGVWAGNGGNTYVVRVEWGKTGKWKREEEI
jgi:hypothetical protein